MFELALEGMALTDVGLATAWGAALGAINHWLLAGPLARWAQAEVAGVAATDIVRQVYGRFLLRMVVSLLGLLVAFLIWSDSVSLLATVAGLLVVNAISLWQNRRRRRMPS